MDIPIHNPKIRGLMNSGQLNLILLGIKIFLYENPKETGLINIKEVRDTDEAYLLNTVYMYNDKEILVYSRRGADSRNNISIQKTGFYTERELWKNDTRIDL